MILAGLGLRRGRHRRMVQKAGDVLHVRELHATYEENDRKVLQGCWPEEIERADCAEAATRDALLLRWYNRFLIATDALLPTPVY